MNVIGGTFANLTTVTNNSTNAIGISVSAGRTLSATSLINAAGATVSNLGTITTTSITNSGTFRNNGTTTGTFTMAAGNLSGVGNTQSLTVNGGTFAPGNGTAGTSMTVTGSLVLQAAATYLVQVNPTTASFTNVTGAATLNGATVSANYAAGSYISKRYTIVTAASGVNGPFGALVTTGQPANLTSTLSYDINNAYLNLNLSFVLPGGVLNQNQQNVGNALTGFFNTTGGISMAFASLTAAQLTQSDGEVTTGSQQSTFNAMNQFMGVMTDPFVAGRGDPVSAGGGATGYADEQTARRNPNDALAAIYRKAPVAADPFAQRWSVWAAGYGGSQTTSGNAVQGSNNTSSNLYGTAVGADYRLSPDALAGFALAGGGTNFSVANGLGSGRSDLFQAGAFVRHNIGAAYLSGALAYGWQDITTNRTLTIAGLDQLQAKFNANAWSGRVEGGYRFVTQGIGLTPYAAGQFTTFDLPAYAEQAISGANTFALAYGARSVTATRSELGLRTDKSFAMEDGVFTLRGRAAWAHDYNPDRAIGTTFQTLPGASFVVNGARQASDAVLLTASVEKKWLNGWSAAGTFEGEFSSVTTSYAGKGVVRYAW
ncbi:MULTISPECIES: autotransporter outer membrane beta-barrel domain-containing protein [Bradyrhizobium]|uniref:autotransporter outer membrane beta-barrel domain-containing protein n=1 Tax=Bradyrhizobium lablabi TaxID=722472 RepID=UPI0009431DD6|nr:MULTISPECIES: autotransporter outer membrane beta-barrel domain-containing protein [Bradyrhizobium]